LERIAKFEPEVEWLCLNAPENIQITGKLSRKRFHAAFDAVDMVILPYEKIKKSEIPTNARNMGMLFWRAIFRTFRTSLRGMGVFERSRRVSRKLQIAR
jgi:hypothetical protein